ncbi:hypothetical protein JOD82_001740 [Paenibacillus sp. 1182]|uniref:Athe_2463 domain-containing protein n=1 Tax=Paenibacillus sp. 1182 TaxID=2806565 RepID=UPI001AE675AC|nr:hypothetical protein [Paenibacillus sp. 1182]MBP1308720.1 hypothetical protein [Paenibacillus sp. 1182]
MKKFRVISALALTALIGLGLTMSFNTDTIKSSALGNVRKTIPNYTGRDPSVDPPYSFRFNPAANTPQSEYYGGSKVFYEELYRGQFLWYSKVKPTDATEADKDMTTMYENRLRVWGKNRSDWLVNKSYSLNLKTGQSEPGKQNYTPGGTTYMVSGPYAGKYLEWRYLGYAFDGSPVNNPYFPPDITPEKWEPWTKNWISEPWDQGLTAGTEYDQMNEKVQWFVDYFFPENPKFRRAWMPIEKDAADWAKKFTLQTDPTRSTGILTGFHVSNGNTYYATLLMKTPAQPNLRMVEYSVYDKETGKLVGKQTMNANDNTDMTETRKYYDQNGKETNKGIIEQGKTYVIKAKVKNMIVKGLDGKNTTYTPIRLNQKYSYDLTSHEMGQWDEEYGNSVLTTKPETTIAYGKTVDFSNQKMEGESEETWEYTVPPMVKKEIVFHSDIVEGFKKKRENTWAQDDVGRLRFFIQPEDIGTPDEALLIDAKGVPVEHVVPKEPYSLRFYVDKVLGEKSVGDPKDPSNPYASLQVVVSDKKTSKTITAVAKEVLTPKGKRVAIDVPNAITPQTSIIEATWQIPQKHRDNNQSMDPSNDGPHKHMWASDINISVSNFNIKPSSFILPAGKSSSNETLTFDFNILSENAENQDKDIDVVIRKDGRVIWRDTVSVPANRNYTMPMVTVPGIDVREGENVFTVEVNPQPRKWIEFLSNATDPNQVYKDNVATNSIMVHKNIPAQNCQILNNQNNWTTIHYIREWHGYREYTEHGSYCVTTSDRRWTEKINYYERYKITNVFFRSKLTKDQALRDGNNGDGWVDLLNGKAGEVKAGYGFEIKYVVKYQTNTYTDSPKPWRADCSGKTVDPTHGSYVDAPNTLQVTMPFKDTSGQPVRYDATTTSESGSWDNLTQNYEMPVRKAFNLKDTREIFINETAKDGEYPVRIDTYSYFYGSYDKKPTSKYLCDYVIVKIKVNGSDKDDVKTHLTQ